MKKAYCILALATVFATLGCQKNEGENNPSGDNNKINIVTSIGKDAVSHEVRRPQLDNDGSGNFANGDMITIHALSESGRKTTLRYGIGVSSLYWTDIDLSESDSKVHFSACYPEQNLVNGKFTFNLETTSDKNLLWAHKQNITAQTDESVEMLFNHVMHRIIINYTTQSNKIDLTQTQTVCTAKSTCNVDLLEKSLDNSSSQKASFTENGKNIEFIVVPQKVSDVSLHVSVGHIDTTFSLDELVTNFTDLNSGMQLTLNLVVKDGSIALENSTISQWGNQGTIEGEIIM